MEIKIFKTTEQKEFKVYYDIIFKNNKIKLFNQYQWLDEVINIYLPKNSDIYLVFVIVNKIPIFFFPFYVENIFKLKVLKYISSEAIDFNYLNVSNDIIDDIHIDLNEVFFKIFKVINPDVVFFDKIVISENKLKLFEHLKCLKKYDINYFLEAIEDYQSFYLNKFNSKTKNTDKRKYNKLKKIGEINYNQIRIDKDNFFLLNNLIENKYNFYIGRKIKTFSKKKLSFLYQSILSKKGKENFIIYNMQIKNKVESSIYGIIFNNVFYLLIPFISSNDYKKYSLGRLHLQKIIEDFLKTKTSINFGIGDNRYKKEWSNKFNNVYYYLYLNNINGLFYFCLVKLYFFIKKNKKFFFYFKNSLNFLYAKK